MVFIADKRAVSLHVKSLKYDAFTPAKDDWQCHTNTNSNSGTSLSSTNLLFAFSNNQSFFIGMVESCRQETQV